MEKQYYVFGKDRYYVKPIHLDIENTIDESETGEEKTIYRDMYGSRGEWTDENFPEDIVPIPPPNDIQCPQWNGTEWIEAGEKPIPNMNGVKNIKLNQNAVLCEQIITTGFRSDAKGSGLQPYRMNRDDQNRLNGMNTIIIESLAIQGISPENMPLFSWQNANQAVCDDDWHYTQIVRLLMEFGAWLTKILKRQDEIKKRILEANSNDELNQVQIDYGDLLNFGEKEETV